MGWANSATFSSFASQNWLQKLPQSAKNSLEPKTREYRGGWVGQKPANALLWPESFGMMAIDGRVSLLSMLWFPLGAVLSGAIL